jgi:tRNA U55 pseudouridine synthase TruB
MRMDGWTESGDLEKEVQEIDTGLVKTIWKTLTRDIFEKNLQEKFTWKLSQIPSKFSAIKIDGKAVYHSARKGKEIVIPSREINIFSIKLLDFSFPEATIEVTVSAGTYIRTLASDIAKSCWLDAYLTMLTRTGICHLSLDQSHDIETLSKEETTDYSLLFPEYPILEVWEIVEPGKNIIPPIVATRLMNWLTQENRTWLKNGIYFLKVESQYRALIEVRGSILQIERNNI